MQLKMRGNIGLALGALVVGLVVLFIGLYMVSTVYTAIDTSINTSASKFNSSYNGMITNTGTIMSVGGLALIVAGLGMAIKTLVEAFK